MINVKTADWSKHLIFEAKRDKDMLKYMLANNIDFSGFQGFAIANIQPTDDVPEHFPMSKMFIVDENGENQETRQQTYAEYFGTMFVANDNLSYLIFLPSFKNKGLNLQEMKAFVEYFGFDNILTLSEGKKLMGEKYILTTEFLKSLSVDELKQWLSERNL